MKLNSWQNVIHHKPRSKKLKTCFFHQTYSQHELIMGSCCLLLACWLAPLWVQTRPASALPGPWPGGGLVTLLRQLAHDAQTVLGGTFPKYLDGISEVVFTISSSRIVSWRIGRIMKLIMDNDISIWKLILH